MRKTLIIYILILSVCIMASCSMQDTGTESRNEQNNSAPIPGEDGETSILDANSGFVKIISNGETITPFGKFAYSQNEEGINADGEFIDYEKVFPTLQTVVYADDFEVLLADEELRTDGFTTYDKDYNRLVNAAKNLQLPAKAGEYYVSVTAGWVKEETYYYEVYYFKLILTEEHVGKFYTTEEIGIYGNSAVTVISNGKSIEAKGYFLHSRGDGIYYQGDELDYKHIFSNLNGLDYADDFDILLPGDGQEIISYSIYDKYHNSYFEDLDKLKLPAEPGEYYIKVLTNWIYENVSYYKVYYFKLALDEKNTSKFLPLDEIEKIRNSSIKVTSNGKSIEPKGYLVWAEKDGIRVNGEPVNILDIDSQLEVLDYSLSLTAEHNGNLISNPKYTMYDKWLNSIIGYSREYTLHIEPGTYYVSVETEWENDNLEYEEMYFFKLHIDSKENVLFPTAFDRDADYTVADTSSDDGMIEITSQAKTILPVGYNADLDDKDGEVYGTTPRNLHEIMSDMEELKHGEDFNIAIKGNYAGDVMYHVYDKNFNRIMSNRNKLALPFESGEYYVGIIATWDSETRIYYFKIIISGKDIEKNSQPPTMTVIFEGETIEAERGSYDWTVYSKDGEPENIKVDIMPPDIVFKEGEPAGRNTEIELSFDNAKPFKIEIHTLYDTFSKTLEGDLGNTILLEVPVYLDDATYEVHAFFKRGDVFYQFEVKAD